MSFETQSKNVAGATQYMRAGVSKFSSVIFSIRVVYLYTLAMATISYSSCIFELVSLCIEKLLYNEMI
jgi:hypothetical protein